MAPETFGAEPSNQHPKKEAGGGLPASKYERWHSAGAGNTKTSRVTRVLGNDLENCLKPPTRILFIRQQISHLDH